MGFRNAIGFRRSAPMALLWIGVALFSPGCYKTESNAAGRPGAAIPAVEALQTRTGSLPLVERLTGIVRARNQVAIHPEITGTITEVLVKNGQVVEKGQPLVQLRDTESRERIKQLAAGYRIAVAQAKQAEAQLKEAQAEQRRSERMSEQKLISDADAEASRTRAVTAEANVELAEARVQQAKANLDEQEEILSQTVIRAPVAGTIGDRNAEVGMFANSGTQLFTLGQLDTVRVDVVLTDRMLEYIKLGQRAEIFTDDDSGKRLNASLSRISPFLHPVAHTTAGEIDLANPDGLLRPGMFVIVDIHYGESEQATLVPLSALYENPTTGKTGLYVSKVPIPGGAPDGKEGGNAQSLTDPVDFDFVPVEVVAKGRMDAGVRGVDPEQWVITIGQDLLGGQSGQARVRAVNWEWVEKLQQLQRQELLQEIMKRQQEQSDSAS
jgi:HlyD family secretion protein